MLYSRVHVHCDDRAEQINAKHKENLEFNSDKPGCTHTDQLSTSYHDTVPKYDLTCSLYGTINSATSRLAVIKTNPRSYKQQCVTASK